MVKAANWLFGTPGHLEMRLCDKAAVRVTPDATGNGATRMIQSPSLMSDIETFGGTKLADGALIGSKLPPGRAQSVRRAVGMWYQRDLWTRALPRDHRNAVDVDANAVETVYLKVYATEAQRSAIESHVTGSDVGVRRFIVAFGDCRDVAPLRFLVDLVAACGAADLRVNIQDRTVDLLFNPAAVTIDAAGDARGSVEGQDGKRSRDTGGAGGAHAKRGGFAQRAIHFARVSGSAIQKKARQKWMNYNAGVARHRVRDID